VYHVGADTIGRAALAAVGIIAPAEAVILDESIEIFKVLTSDPASTDFVNDALSLFGTSTGGSSLLPLFNTVRALIHVDGFGRNDSKYYRGFISEDISENGLLSSGAISVVQGMLVSLLSDMSDNGTPLLADDSSAWLSTSVQQAIQMRQLHRRRRRTP